MKTFVILLVFAAAQIIIATACRADIEGLPAGTEETLSRLEATMFPPETHTVTLKPDPPKADTITEITVEVYNNAGETEDKTTDAWVIYSSDGGSTWDQIDLEQMADGKTWKGELPAFPAGAEVLYGIRAKDTTTNVYTETPCLVTSWPPDGDPCMFDLAVDDEPVDDDPALVPDDFDILGFRGGEDDEYLYAEIKVQGKASAGTLAPTYAHIYGIVVQNPDRGSPNDIVTQGFLGVWIPYASAFGYQDCMVISKPGADVKLESGSITCKTDGDSRLWFKVNKKEIGSNPRRYIRIMAADGAITNFSPLQGLYYDYSHITSLVFKDRWFTVE
ncbi:MAG: hypothetical protein WCX65_19565 [bacterium]